MSQQAAKTAVKALHAYGKEHGQRITEPREHVLSIIASAEQPLTAYDVLDLLGQKLDKPKPPTAYRALEFLVKHGFIHRIDKATDISISHIDLREYLGSPQKA